MYAIASSAAFKPNVAKLASRLGIGRDTLLRHLVLLERADLIIALRAESKGVAALAKPDKVYLNNPNLLYALSPEQVEIGTLRETFFVNQMKHLTQDVQILPPEIRVPAKGDFVWSHRGDRYLFEVGGANKTRTQIGRSKFNFAVIDSEQSGQAQRIPLWLFGLLY